MDCRSRFLAPRHGDLQDTNNLISLGGLISGTLWSSKNSIFQVQSIDNVANLIINLSLV